MRMFQITAAHYPGFAAVEYNDAGVLTSFEHDLPFDSKQIAWLTARLSSIDFVLNEPMMASWKLKVLEVKLNPTFEEFYNAGLPKRNKERAQKFWNKLTEADRALAYVYIKRYIATLPAGVNAKYPDTYINNKTWLD